MPLFRFHDSKGPPPGYLDRGTGRYAGLYGDSEPGDFLPPCFMYHGRKEISPLRSASVEMTRGALANIVISSGDACRYGADGKHSHDTLSREISRVMLPVPSEGGEISPLRSASVEMTGGALANIVISSGGTCRYGRQTGNAPMIL